MADFEEKDDARAVSRRSFLRTSATAGLGAAFAGTVLGREQAAPTGSQPPGQAPDLKPADEIRVGLIGAGEQGRVLVESCLRIPGVRIAALCDIWEYSRQYASGYLGKYGQKPVVYEDYRDMLAKEKSLDAAIVASPDWVHAEHANACLGAGLHVYCE